MASITQNNDQDDQTIYQTSNCPLNVCPLRMVSKEGTDECLMESVRSLWTQPNADNYCADPFCRKFVSQFKVK